MSTADILRDPSLVLIFAYAPAGLGHLRVTDALFHGLPTGTAPILLGTQDKSISYIHRIMSVHTIGRWMMEWAQYGTPQSIFTVGYRQFLRSRTNLLYQQIVTVLDQRLTVPKTVVVLATHFGLAHQLAEIKQKLEKEKEVNVILVVQVTDDSPQYIWYVDGADLIFVPSHRTREQLQRYGKEVGLPPVRMEVIPYPVSRRLGTPLPEEGYRQRKYQLASDGNTAMHIAIPISGAAVGMKFFTSFIDTLAKKAGRHTFHIIGKISPHTQPFINHMLGHSDANLVLSTHDREVVEKYEQLYQKTTISLEVTKPSEQAFKALLSPHHIGGAVLLFATPVGRQEYDNLEFLERHKLIPAKSVMTMMWNKSRTQDKLQGYIKEEIHEYARRWRGLRISENPVHAAGFVHWCKEQGIFAAMVSGRKSGQDEDRHPDELGSDGVEKFWKWTADFLKQTT